MLTRLYLNLVAGFVLSLASSTAFAALAQFDGDWHNTDMSHAAVTRLQVQISGSRVSVHAWGKCHPHDCDWGATRAQAYAPAVNSSLTHDAKAVSAVFKTGFSETLLVLHPQHGNRLRVALYTRFTDNSGRSNYTRVEHFARQGRTSSGARVSAGLSGEDCVRFDYRRARLQRVDGHWKIGAASTWLVDFGAQQGEARQALRVLKHYRLTRQCFVGRPHPSMEYYLSDGRGPRGALRGEDCVGFNPARIEVRRIDGHWKIVDGSHWLLDFGASEAEARQAHRILRHYRFTHACFVGRPHPSLRYFRR